VASGSTAEEAAQMVLAHRTSVSHWIRAYLAQGLEGLYITEGRGRQAQVDAEELDRYIRQSPRAFGIELNRWTLKALAQAVPSLKGLTEPGVKKALERYGYGYKRGQPHLHSPDPDYEQKKGLWTKR
jgi:transposase